MSRNKQRTEAASTPAAAPTTATEPTPQKSATLSYVAPTEFVELPSRGKFYPPEHALHNKEVIEMRYMTARDEDILTSPSLLKSGLALDRLVQNLVVENIDIDSLLIGDKNALLVAARISGYGKDYTVATVCETCGANNQSTFNLSELPINYGVQPDTDTEASVTLDSDGTFVAELPKTKFSVKFRLLTGGDEKHLNKIAEKINKLNLPNARATTLLKQLIISVNDVHDTSEIHNFVDNMPAQDARFLRGCVQIATPNIEMVQDIECSSCGATTEMAVPFTSEFFWPN